MTSGREVGMEKLSGREKSGRVVRNHEMSGRESNPTAVLSIFETPNPNSNPDARLESIEPGKTFGLEDSRTRIQHIEFESTSLDSRQHCIEVI